MTTTARPDSINIADAPPLTWNDVMNRVYAVRHEIFLHGWQHLMDTARILLSSQDKAALMADARLTHRSDTLMPKPEFAGIPYEFRDEISPREIVIRWEIQA